ncbi:hypothetical protein MRB53_011917 [Persea americana]|uniref:Uncharacterized protein n=1 Tax=Persea americana TaxID=3435 RepID=A0ACC2LW64_PERAE|nr:hypothetical protein MRB53_011917 [Persea americana]
MKQPLSQLMDPNVKSMHISHQSRPRSSTSYACSHPCNLPSLSGQQVFDPVHERNFVARTDSLDYRKNTFCRPINIERTRRPSSILVSSADLHRPIVIASVTLTSDAPDHLSRCIHRSSLEVSVFNSGHFGAALIYTKECQRTEETVIPHSEDQGYPLFLAVPAVQDNHHPKIPWKPTRL